MFTRLAALLSAALLFLALPPTARTQTTRTVTPISRQTLTINAITAQGRIYASNVVIRAGVVQTGYLYVAQYAGNAVSATVSPGGAVCLTACGAQRVGGRVNVVWLRTYCANPSARPPTLAAAVYQGDPVTGLMTSTRLFWTGGQVRALTGYVSVKGL